MHGPCPAHVITPPTEPPLAADRTLQPGRQASPDQSPSPSQPNRLAWLALLSGLAVLLNGLPVPLFYGIHVMLGSVPAIYALLLWPRWWGVAIGVLASLRTWPLWGHPWAVVIFTLELVWLWLWLRRAPAARDARGNGDVLLLAIGYWLLIGAPLVFAFYGLVMRIDPANVLVVAVKQSFNGVLNTELAFAALMVTRALQARRDSGPGLSLRGVIIALALFALTLPTLLISITAGHQLQRAVEQGVLDGLKTVNLAVSRVGPGQQTNQLLIDQLGGDLAYRRIAADGSTTSSDRDLFHRLDSLFSDGGRSQVSSRELALLIPRGEGPALHKWVNGFWSFSSQSTDPAGTALVQVVQPARSTVTRMQEQSSQLLAASLVVVALGALLSALVGRQFEREFNRVLHPRQGEGPRDGGAGGAGSCQPPLRLTSVSELRALTSQLNQRIFVANELYRQLQESNGELQRSRLELERLLTTDPLTGCGNSQALAARLREEWHRSRRNGEPVSCLWFSIDGLELACQRFGSAAGDALIKGAAQALRNRLRVTDHIFRCSRRDLVVVATGCSEADAGRLGATLAAAITAIWIRPGDDQPPGAPACRLNHRDHPELTVQPRVGCATLDPQGDTVDSLLERARKSMEASGPSPSPPLSAQGLTS